MARPGRPERRLRRRRGSPAVRVAGDDDAIPRLAVADTLRREHADGSWSPVPRDATYRAQTPQGFRFAASLKAHRDFAAHDVTDDMALAERAGLKIVRVAGEETNMKITTGDDMAHAERLLAGAARVSTRVRGWDRKEAGPRAARGRGKGKEESRTGVGHPPLPCEAIGRGCGTKGA